MSDINYVSMLESRQLTTMEHLSLDIYTNLKIQGLKDGYIAKKMGLNSTDIYHWKQKYGGLHHLDLRRMTVNPDGTYMPARISEKEEKRILAVEEALQSQPETKTEEVQQESATSYPVADVLPILNDSSIEDRLRDRIQALVEENRLLKNKVQELNSVRLINQEMSVRLNELSKQADPFEEAIPPKYTPEHLEVDNTFVYDSITAYKDREESFKQVIKGLMELANIH